MNDPDDDPRALAAWHRHKSSTDYREETKDAWMESWYDERAKLMVKGHPGLTYRRHELYWKER